jgi:transcriptional regulator with XRE-family HTH domain
MSIPPSALAAPRPQRHGKRVAPRRLDEALNAEAFNVGEFCRKHSLTQDTFTRLTGFSARAVRQWAKGRSPSSSTQRRLAEINRLFIALGRVISADRLGQWLQKPDGQFQGSTPLQVIERGEFDRIWRLLYEIESGQPE